MAGREKTPDTLGQKVKKAAVRQAKKKVRRAAMEATRARLGMDRKDRRETPEKKAMYAVWMGRAKEDAESGEEEQPAVPPVYAVLGAVCGAMAACQFCAGMRTRRRLPYYAGFAYLSACGVYAALDCLYRTGRR